ncbi:hypothetical protein EDB86DRAFT_3242278 [Lactarius hatsudake]|nr:hypothetical protein EDB86DRAFT_3242278 [Lactarius hatsudake]
MTLWAGLTHSRENASGQPIFLDERSTQFDTTPLRQKVSNSGPHSFTPVKTKTSSRYKNMAVDPCERFVGPMPVELFLSEFVPEAPNTRPTAPITFAHKTVSQNENEFASIAALIRLIEDAGLCPNLKFFNTTHCISANLKPDIAIYSGTDRDDLGTHSGSQRSLNWTAVDLWIENEKKGSDVFRDLEQIETENQDLKSHTHDGQKVLVNGIIYTEPFNWSTQPDILFEFLWRLNFLSDVKRGYDTTVTSVEDDEAEAALSKLRTYQGSENVAKADLHKFLVRDDHTPSGQIKYYIAPSAVWDSESLFGRSTFGYIAYNPDTMNLVYLKDFWRTDRDGIQKEGDVYRELHDAQVSNIAKLGLAGDVPLLPECGRTDSPAVQRTITQEFVKDWCPGRPRVDPYVHYRLVLETLGSPLHTFKSTRELCKVIRDAITAHTEAYERVQILHRDVSAGNILITENGSGILIDWDLSKKVVKGGSGKQRQHSRTGTWQFMSIARLQDSSTRPHEVSDDLESFFWVLLYLVVKCKTFSTKCDTDDDGITRGGRGKLYCLRQGDLGHVIVEFLVQTPCRDIIEELRSLFDNLYRHVQPFADTIPRMQSRIKSKRDQDESVQDALMKLRSSEEVLSIINKHLDSTGSWDVDNDGSLYKVKFLPDPATSRNRRKRKAEDDGRDFNERRRGRFPPSSTQPSQSRDMLGLQRHQSSFGSAGGSRTRPSENE